MPLDTLHTVKRMKLHCALQTADCTLNILQFITARHQHCLNAGSRQKPDKGKLDLQIVWWQETEISRDKRNEYCFSYRRMRLNREAILQNVDIS